MHNVFALVVFVKGSLLSLLLNAEDECVLCVFYISAEYELYTLRPELLIATRKVLRFANCAVVEEGGTTGVHTARMIND